MCSLVTSLAKLVLSASVFTSVVKCFLFYIILGFFYLYWQHCCFCNRKLNDKDIFWSIHPIYRHRHRHQTRHLKMQYMMVMHMAQTHTVYTRTHSTQTVNNKAFLQNNKTLPSNNFISHCNHVIHTPSLLAPLVITWHSCVPQRLALCLACLFIVLWDRKSVV